MGDDHPLLGPYRLERLVARGGMGEIWRAVDQRDGSQVAVKRVRHEATRSLPATLRQRLLREMRAFEALRHENIVHCLGSGLDDDDQPYLALEWLDGEDLARRQRRAPLRIAEIVEVARQALRGLQACHAEGLVHRDVKPANLFVVAAPGAGGDAPDFVVKLLDFGLARRLDDQTAHLTTTGAVVGTLYYLAPEQAHGRRDIDGRADLYALGVVLYELCTGQLPFAGEGPAAVLLRIVTERPPRPRVLRPDIPRWLEALVLRAMARDADERFADAAQMLAALERGAAADGADNPGADGGAAASEAATLDDSRPSSSLEQRLVWLLCARQADAGHGGLAAVAREHITAAGGSCIELLGAQTVGLFGTDRSAGDEARRAVEAGLHIRDHAAAGAQLFVTAIHLAIGDGARFDAQRLERAISDMRSLPPGELFCDRATRELLGPLLELRRVEGREAVNALRPSARRQLLGVETPLVGRETELAAIVAAADRAEQYGEPELLVVEGTAGIGKSRLCQEALGALGARCSLVLEARAEPLHGRAPYATLRQLIARACGSELATCDDEKRAALRAFIASRTADLDARALLFIDELLGLAGDDDAALQVARQAREVMREGTLSALAALFEGAGRRGPLLLVVDDLQWADMESVQLLSALPARLSRTPLFLLLAARPELDDAARAALRSAEPTHLALAPLSRRALRRLMRAARVEDSPELEALVADWSDGTPYFAEELLAWLASRAALVRHDAGWRLEVTPTALELPTSIEAAVQARLDHLAARDKELLRSAAIFGETFWDRSCVALGFDEAAEQLRALEGRQLVVRQARSRFAHSAQWAFRHAFVHQVAAQMNPPAHARALHARAARWLEDAGESDPVVLAHHFEGGGEGARAAHYREAAGERALRGGDLDQAVEHCLAALSLAPDEISRAEQTRRTIGLARACILLGDYAQASMALDHAEADDETQAGELALLRGRILFGRGDYAGAESTLARALELLDDHEVSFLARHTLFSVIWAQGRYDDAARVANALLAQASASSREDQQCAAKLAQAYANTVSGDLSASVRLTAEAAEHARAVGHVYREVDCLALLASLQELVGLYDQARAALEQAGALADRLKTTYHQATVDAGRGRLLLLVGEVDAAVVCYRRAIAAAERIENHRTLVGALAGEARALALPGESRDLGRARAAAQRALDLAGSHAPPSLAEARLALAEVFLADEDVERGREHAVAAMELLDQLGGQERYEIEILLTARQALLRTGDDHSALALLQRAAACVQRRAKKISDTQLRRSFVERVPHNARVAALLKESAGAAC